MSRGSHVSRRRRAARRERGVAHQIAIGQPTERLVQRERRHEHHLAFDERARDPIERGGLQRRPLQLEGRPAAEEVVVRPVQPLGFGAGSVRDAAQVLDAGHAEHCGLGRRRLAEVRGHGHAPGARLLHDHRHQRRMQLRVDLDDPAPASTCRRTAARAETMSLTTIASFQKLPGPSIIAPAAMIRGRDGASDAASGQDVVRLVVDVANRGDAVLQEQRQRPGLDVHVRVDEAGNHRAAEASRRSAAR